jgi:hypothetical protein
VAYLLTTTSVGFVTGLVVLRDAGRRRPRTRPDGTNATAARS